MSTRGAVGEGVGGGWAGGDHIEVPAGVVGAAAGGGAGAEEAGSLGIVVEDGVSERSESEKVTISFWLAEGDI
jgi:hypothetical protein